MEGNRGNERELSNILFPFQYTKDPSNVEEENWEDSSLSFIAFITLCFRLDYFSDSHKM